MNLISIFRHESWYNIQGNAPLWARHSLIPCLNFIREYAILIFRPYLTVYQLKGQSKAGTIAMHYAVNGADTQLKLYLKNILFGQEPVEEKILKIPLWHLGRLINNPAVDLTLIGASGNLIRRLPAKNTIVLPRLVDQILDVRGEWKDVQARFHHQVRNGEMRLIRKYGYQIETSNKDTDFEKFFHEMYIPSMKMRHGYQAHILSWTEAYECFKQGVLFLTKRDGIYVSGSVCVTQSASGVVHGLLIGVLQADQQLVKEGAQGVLYYAVAQWANTHGYEAVDFEATEPFLKKGILQYKKKWGTVIRIPRNDRKRLWLKIQRHTPAVNQFLKDNPCIMINKQGDLQGLFFVDDSDQVPADTKAEWDKLCAMPGLKGYCIYPVENLV